MTGHIDLDHDYGQYILQNLVIPSKTTTSVGMQKRCGGRTSCHQSRRKRLYPFIISLLHLQKCYLSSSFGVTPLRIPNWKRRNIDNFYFHQPTTCLNPQRYSLQNSEETPPVSSSLQKYASGDRWKHADWNETYNFWEDSLSVTSFNMDLENLAQDDPQKAADALEIMEHMYQRDPDNDYYVKPNAACYTTVINGWVQFEGLTSSHLMDSEDIKDSDNNRLSYARHPYNGGNNHHHFGAQQAQAWLDCLEERYKTTGDPELKPNTVSYMLVCQKWADDYVQDVTGESAEKAEQILEKMRSRLDDSSNYDDVKVWTIVLEAWCKRAGKVRGAIHRAEKILNEMEERSKTQDEQSMSRRGSKTSVGATIRPNIVTYTSFIGGLARSKERNTAGKAEEILERMQRICGIEPDMVAYTAVLNCYSKTTSRKERSQAAKRALEILDLMESQFSQEQKFYLKPNVITYGTAIKAIGNSLDSQSAELAEKVMRRMYSLHEAGTVGNIKPQTSTYNAVISAFAANSRRSGRHQQTSSYNARQRPKSNSKGVANARRAEQLLVEMTRRAREGENDVQPNVRTWGAVLSAWAESGQPDAGEQCRRVLSSMEQLYKKSKSTVRSNYVCYTTAMAAMGYSALPNTSEEAMTKNRAAADQLEKMLIKMEKDYEETMEVDKRPNTITYITAIDSLCKLDEENAAEMSQSIIDRMVRLYAKGLGHVRPSRIVFNSLINAWSRSPDRGLAAAQKAEEIFKWMERQYRESGDYIVKPDEVSLCGVLNAWANNAEHGGARRAQQILDHMEAIGAKDRGFQHTTICHNIVIKAWGRSKEPDAVEQADRILNRLEKLWKTTGDENLKPDVTTYSSVINCCAYYSGAFGGGRASGADLNSVSAIQGRKKALDVATRTFQKLCSSSSAKPNNITYGTLFKAIANLTPINEERDYQIRTLFERCCREGQVDAFVLSQVRNACTDSLYRELVLEPSGSKTTGFTENINTMLRKMPAEWCANSGRE